tara:strand:+ start:1388 stop:1495 length:108 start_codon:yes stop_codon:yes gene_type:complete
LSNQNKYKRRSIPPKGKAKIKKMKKQRQRRKFEKT